MKSAITIALVLTASPVFADEAASALADCKVHQQRLQDLEDSYVPPPEPNTEATFYTPGQFGENELQHQRAITERSCNYAKALRAAPPRQGPKAAVTERAPFRSDEPPPASKPPVFDEHPPVTPAPPPPPPRPLHREVMRRPPPPPPPPQANVGGTKARHAPDESQPQPPPQ